MGVDNITDQLLKEFRENREKLQEMIVEIETVREGIEKLFPDKLEARYKYLFEERVKTVVSVFTTLLDIRKEIARTLKDELDVRRKLSGDLSDDEIEDMIDVRRLAKKVEQLQKKKEKSEAKLELENLKKEEPEKPPPKPESTLEEKKPPHPLDPLL